MITSERRKPIERGTDHGVGAPKILAGGRRVFNFKMLTNSLPDNIKHVRGTGHLKIIDVDNKENLGLTMPIAGSPFRDRHEPNGDEVFLAMLFPISSCIRVAIQCQP
jgi:hypothetical protein